MKPLRTTTDGDVTQYGVVVRLMRRLSLWLDDRVERAAERSWSKAHR